MKEFTDYFVKLMNLDYFNQWQEENIFDGILNDDYQKIDKELRAMQKQSFNAEIDFLIALLPINQRTVYRGISLN